MAVPKLVAVIGATVANASIGEFIIIRNLTQGGKLVLKVNNADGKVVFNKAPVEEWKDGDLIQGEIRGRVKGIKQEKIGRGGAIIQIVASTDTATAGVSL